MEISSLLNAASLVIEICGVGVLASIDLVDRQVLEAHTRLQKAHYAYLGNQDPALEQHFLLRRNNPADTKLVESHDPRKFGAKFRLALSLLALGMAGQLVANFL